MNSAEASFVAIGTYFRNAVQLFHVILSASRKGCGSAQTAEIQADRIATHLTLTKYDPTPYLTLSPRLTFPLLTSSSASLNILIVASSVCSLLTSTTAVCPGFRTFAGASRGLA